MTATVTPLKPELRPALVPFSDPTLRRSLLGIAANNLNIKVEAEDTSCTLPGGIEVTTFWLDNFGPDWADLPQALPIGLCLEKQDKDGLQWNVAMAFFPAIGDTSLERWRIGLTAQARGSSIGECPLFLDTRDRPVEPMKELRKVWHPGVFPEARATVFTALGIPETHW